VTLLNVFKNPASLNYSLKLILDDSTIIKNDYHFSEEEEEEEEPFYFPLNL
jgi:hypothetical protein